MQSATRQLTPKSSSEATSKSSPKAGTISPIIREDHKIIENLIPKKAKVLDLGCGEGDLLHLLKKSKQIKGSGIEISADGVSASIAKGLSVIQGDIEHNISHYGDNTFDYCILSQTLQELKNPTAIISEMLRISKYSLISFYNLAHFKYRLKILFQGGFPKSKDLPYNWMTTNIAFLSIKDFESYCDEFNIQIEESEFLAHAKKVNVWPNLRSNLCVFKISR